MHLRLRTLLWGTLLTLAALAVIAALAMISLARDGRASASYLVDSVRSVESAERIALDLHELQYGDELTGDAAAQALIEDVALNRSLIQSAAEDSIIVRLEARVARLLASRAAETGDARGAGRSSEAFQAALAKANQSQMELLQINLEQARAAEASTDEHGERATRIAALVAGLLILTMGTLMITIHAQLIRPLASLRENIHRLALGETFVRVPERRTVELSELSSTFNSMAALLDEQRRGRAEILGRAAGALETPLSALRSQLERLSPGAKVPGEEELRRLHAQIVRQSLQLEQRVVEFLDAARAEAGELTFSFAPCDLREMVRESIELFHGVSPAHTLELTAPQPVFARADALRLQQVLHALLALALRRAPGGGTINIRVLARSGSAELSIAAAEGAPPESFEALFNDLHGLGVALRDVPGVLFGLDVSRKLVEAHGGTIEVDPAGTRFLLSLPLVPDAQLAQSLSPALQSA